MNNIGFIEFAYGKKIYLQRSIKMRINLSSACSILFYMKCRN